MRKQLAERLRLLARIESLGRPVTQRIARQISDAGVTAVKTGGVHIDAKKITEQLVELMLLSYVKRYRLAKNELRLSFGQDVRKAAAGLDLNLDNLHRSFVAHTGPRVQDAADHYAERINVALNRISGEQLSTRSAIVEMRRELDTAGLAPTNPSIIETLTRTHSQLAFGAAQWQLNQDDPHGLITGYVFSAVMDDRTTDECASLNDVVFAKDDPALSSCWPPNHWQCRSQMIEQSDPIEPSSVPGSLIESAVDEEFRFNPGELLD